MYDSLAKMTAMGSKPKPKPTPKNARVEAAKRIAAELKAKRAAAKAKQDAEIAKMKKDPKNYTKDGMYGFSYNAPRG